MSALTRRRALAIGAVAAALGAAAYGPLTRETRTGALRRLFGRAMADSPAGRAIAEDLEQLQARTGRGLSDLAMVRLAVQSSTVIAWSEGRGALVYDQLFLPYAQPCANYASAAFAPEGAA
jgi:hypothetical protein